MFGMYSSSRSPEGYGTSKPVTRSTGALSVSKQPCVISCATSAPSPEVSGRLVDDDGAPRLPHGGRQRRCVDRLQPAQVQDFNVDPVLGGELGHLQAAGHHGAPRDEGQVPARAHDLGAGGGAAGGGPAGSAESKLPRPSASSGTSAP